MGKVGLSICLVKLIWHLATLCSPPLSNFPPSPPDSNRHGWEMWNPDHLCIAVQCTAVWEHFREETSSPIVQFRPLFPVLHFCGESAARFMQKLYWSPIPLTHSIPSYNSHFDEDDICHIIACGLYDLDWLWWHRSSAEAISRA